MEPHKTIVFRRFSGKEKLNRNLLLLLSFIILKVTQYYVIIKGCKIITSV